LNPSSRPSSSPALSFERKPHGFSVRALFPAIRLLCARNNGDASRQAPRRATRYPHGAWRDGL
ncbi:hypothetical protein, partial [Burkholderia cenocepacia]